MNEVTNSTLLIKWSNIVSLGDSLTNNHHYEPKWWSNVWPQVVRGPFYTFAISIKPELQSGPPVMLKELKESFIKYDLFLSMMATWFMGDWIIMNSHSHIDSQFYSKKYNDYIMSTFKVYCPSIAKDHQQ